MRAQTLVMLMIGSLAFAGETELVTKPVQKIEFESEAVDVDVSPDGDLIAVTLYSGTRVLLNKNLDVLWRNTNGGINGWAGDTLFLPNSKYAAMTAFGTIDAVVLLSLDDYSIQSLPLCHKAYIRAVAVSPDGKTLATGDVTGIVVLWNLSSLQEASTFKAHCSQVRSLSFSEDGSLLAISGAPEVELWSVTNSPVRKATLLPKAMTKNKKVDPATSVVAVQFLRNSTLLVGMNANKGLFVWDTAGNYRSMKVIEIIGYANQFTSSPDGSAVALAPYHYGTIPILDARNGFVVTTQLRERGDSLAIYDLDYSPDGSTLYSVGQSKFLKVWKLN